MRIGDGWIECWTVKLIIIYLTFYYDCVCGTPDVINLYMSVDNQNKIMKLFEFNKNFIKNEHIKIIQKHTIEFNYLLIAFVWYFSVSAQK